MSDVSDREKFDFEREKWRADIEMRSREVAVKERDQARSKWWNPLVLAILGATLAAGGNLYVAKLNGRQQVDLEEGKAESARILEMTKTGNTETAAGNLQFLVDSGLIANPERVRKITQFLHDRAPGSGPSLPAAVSFEPSDVLSESTRQTLDKLMKDYVSALGKIGFQAGETVRVKIELMPSGPNAYYLRDEKQMVIDSRITGDRSVPLREFNHHVLAAKNPQAAVWQYAGNETNHYAAIESGLADYLACSYLNNPKFGELAAKALGMQRPFIRNMANDRNFDGTVSEPHDLGEVWSGALWAMRTALGRDVIDPIITKAWLSTNWPDAEPEKALAFTTALVAAASQQGPDKATAVSGVLRKRGFPVPN